MNGVRRLGSGSYCGFTLLFLASLFLVACQKPLTDEECGRLLDHYTDKVIDQARPSTGQAERAELLQAARRKAKMDPAFAQCSSRVSRKDFECALEAHNADQIERCLM